VNTKIQHTILKYVLNYRLTIAPNINYIHGQTTKKHHKNDRKPNSQDVYVDKFPLHTNSLTLTTV